MNFLSSQRQNLNWVSEDYNQGVSRAVIPTGGPEEEPVPLPFPASRGFLPPTVGGSSSVAGHTLQPLFLLPRFPLGLSPIPLK